MNEENEVVPIQIGTLKITQGINGFKKAEPGHPVFDFNNRYVIFLESLDGSVTTAVTYYYETLKPLINFTDNG